jgi:hypothetical protein
VLPQSTVPAQEQAEALNWLSKQKLVRGLRALERGDVNPAAVRVYEEYPNKPPWQRVVFGGDLIVIFRALTEAERAALAADEPPRFFVVRVVKPDAELPALEALMAEKHAQEEGEEGEEEGGREPR